MQDRAVEAIIGLEAVIHASLRSMIQPIFEMVPRGGLEPPCGYPRWILSPLRLPFRHLGIEGVRRQRLCQKAAHRDNRIPLTSRGFWL